MSEPGNGHDRRILQSLRRIIRAVEIHSRKLSAHHKITGPQLVCLLAAAERGPMKASELARQVHLSPSTIVGILDSLSQKGLLRRERDDRDRRLVRVTITEKGRAVAKNAPSPLQDKLSEGLARLSDAERATISHALERVVEMMEDRQGSDVTQKTG